MRLAACALSAVLLSGCSWLGMGNSHQSGQTGFTNGAYGTNCAPAQGYNQGFQAQGYGAGCAGHHGAGFQNAGFAQQGFGQQQGYGYAGGQQQPYGQDFGNAGYGAQAGYGTGPFAGVAGYGPAGVPAGLAAQGIGDGYGQTTFDPYGSGVTTLGAAAPYGAAAYGGNVVGTQLSNGQYVNGQYVQNVQGAPIYVPQPYGVPAYGAQGFGGQGFAAGPCGPGLVPCGTQLRGGSAAMPFGFEVFGGTEFDIDGDILSREAVSPSIPPLGGTAGGLAGTFDTVTYGDAFSEGFAIGGATTYDISRNTTLIGSVGYSQKEGQVVPTGSFTSGTFADPANPTVANFTPDAGATARDVQGEFTDLEQVTIEAGVRQYIGQNRVLRPYLGASAGFAYNNAVDFTQTFVDDGSVFSPTTEFIDSGWTPTAAGVVGAELAVGPRAAVGVETGIRWRDNLDVLNGGKDRLSIPLSLRGRLAF